MAASSNRDRLYVQPLGSSRRLAIVEPLSTLPAGAERVAELDEGARGGEDYGWLIRLPTGRYAILQVTGAMKSVDQRKAQAAVDAWQWRSRGEGDMEMEGGDDIEPPKPDPVAEAKELAAVVKAWRRDMPVSRAAQLLGMPARTLEGIEQGRGFRYSRLLILAILAFDGANPKT